MRDTGDIVRKTSAGLMFLGRRDSIFKYHGKKIDPTRLAKRLAGNRLVESCHSHFARREQLLYFFVVLCTGCEAETAVLQLRQEMAGECLCPIRIEAVHGWPLTSHGECFSGAGTYGNACYTFGLCFVSYTIWPLGMIHVSGCWNCMCG